MSYLTFDNDGMRRKIDTPGQSGCAAHDSDLTLGEKLLHDITVLTARELKKVGFHKERQTFSKTESKKKSFLYQRLLLLPSSSSLLTVVVGFCFWLLLLLSL